MRSQMKVTDLSEVQWQYLWANLALGGREFLPAIPKACVVFEHSGADKELHVEMDLVELAGLMVTLTAIDLRRTAEAALTPDAQPDEPRRPVLPTPEQVRNWAAREEVEMARRMNEPPLAEVYDPATGRYTVDPDA